MGNQPPPQKRGQHPQFSVHVLWPNGWTDQDATWFRGSLGSGDIVLDVNPASLPQKGRGSNPPPQKKKIVGLCIVAKRLDGSRCHLAGGSPLPWSHCVRRGPSSHSPKTTSFPRIFGPCLLCPNGRPSQLLLSTCLVLVLFLDFSGFGSVQYIKLASR